MTNVSQDIEGTLSPPAASDLPAASVPEWAGTS